MTSTPKPVKRLLVIEDDRILRRFYQQALEPLCENLTVVATHGEALHHLTQNTIDFLITDLRLEHSSGLDIIQKAVELHPSIAILVASGHVTDEGFQGDLNACSQVKGYLQKPFTLEELHQKILWMLSLSGE